MPYHNEGIFIEGLWVEDKKKLPSDIPEVSEIGLTSAPMESMAFFFHEHCKDYAEDFSLCKNENNDPRHCLKEGRRVTRCGIDLVKKLQKNCDEQWRAHWKCLDKKNHHFWQCRSEEREFNDCVFNKLGLKKVVPDTPEGETPIHERVKQAIQ